MNELSLFSGAGGGLLGTYLLGWKSIGYVEFNDYCQRASNKKKRASGHTVQNRGIYQYLVRFGKPCPTTFYEWLMGMPIGATALEPLGMDKFQQWLQQHGIR